MISRTGWLAVFALTLFGMTGCVRHRGGPIDCMANGCCHGCRHGGEVYPECGCGEAYYGDWISHSPSCHPCDCHGNFTGQACSNPDCRHLNHHGCATCSTGCAEGCEGECGHHGHAPIARHVVGKMRHVLHPHAGCSTCGQ